MVDARLIGQPHFSWHRLHCQGLSVLVAHHSFPWYFPLEGGSFVLNVFPVKRALAASSQYLAGDYHA